MKAVTGRWSSESRAMSQMLSRQPGRRSTSHRLQYIDERLSSPVHVCFVSHGGVSGRSLILEAIASGGSEASDLEPRILAPRADRDK